MLYVLVVRRVTVSYTKAQWSGHYLIFPRVFSATRIQYSNTTRTVHHGAANGTIFSRRCGLSTLEVSPEPPIDTRDLLSTVT